MHCPTWRWTRSAPERESPTFQSAVWVSRARSPDRSHGRRVCGWRVPRRQLRCRHGPSRSGSRRSSSRRAGASLWTERHGRGRPSALEAAGWRVHFEFGGEGRDRAGNPDYRGRRGRARRTAVFRVPQRRGLVRERRARWRCRRRRISVGASARPDMVTVRGARCHADLRTGRLGRGRARDAEPGAFRGL